MNNSLKNSNIDKVLKFWWNRKNSTFFSFKWHFVRVIWAKGYKTFSNYYFYERTNVPSLIFQGQVTHFSLMPYCKYQRDQSQSQIPWLDVQFWKWSHNYNISRNEFDNWPHMIHRIIYECQDSCRAERLDKRKF